MNSSRIAWHLGPSISVTILITDPSARRGRYAHARSTNARTNASSTNDRKGVGWKRRSHAWNEADYGWSWNPTKSTKGQWNYGGHHANLHHRHYNILPLHDYEDYVQEQERGRGGGGGSERELQQEVLRGREQVRRGLLQQLHQAVPGCSEHEAWDRAKWCRGGGGGDLHGGGDGGH